MSPSRDAKHASPRFLGVLRGHPHLVIKREVKRAVIGRFDLYRLPGLHKGGVRRNTCLYEFVIEGSEAARVVLDIHPDFTAIHEEYFVGAPRLRLGGRALFSRVGVGFFLGRPRFDGDDGEDKVWGLKVCGHVPITANGRVQ